ncbi:hypothetical protein GCM10010357_44850 [Streptomyces luteireticuli]|uniref:Dipeptidase n=1 Tax=Streptomyces luteireticuli TaxID=173858 RepID=A0ABN0YY39_9ACTN
MLEDVPVAADGGGEPVAGGAFAGEAGLSIQEAYFAEYAEQLRAENPQWTVEQIHTAASRYVSPPVVAPHPAGAAIDITLADSSEVELDLGTRMNATPEESEGACYMDAANITSLHRARRRILVTAMSSAGFVNYPSEWWRWSHRDHYWALVTGAPAAAYGPVTR